MILFNYLFSNTCIRRLAYLFGLHCAHKLDMWQCFCVLLIFAYFQQQNTETYRSKFYFFSCFFGGYSKRKWFTNFALRQSSFFFRVEYRINKLVETIDHNYHTYFLATFTFCTLYSTFLRVFLLLTFFAAKQCWQMSTPCVDRSFPVFFKLYIDKACILLFKKSEYRTILYLSGIRNSTVTFFTHSFD